MHNAKEERSLGDHEHSIETGIWTKHVITITLAMTMTGRSRGDQTSSVLFFVVLVIVTTLLVHRPLVTKPRGLHYYRWAATGSRLVTLP